MKGGISYKLKARFETLFLADHTIKHIIIEEELNVSPPHFSRTITAVRSSSCDISIGLAALVQSHPFEKN